jgi:hypothetical protein
VALTIPLARTATATAPAEDVFRLLKGNDLYRTAVWWFLPRNLFQI